MKHLDLSNAVIRSGFLNEIYIVQLFTEKGTIAKEIEAGGIV
jgi:hypothetical protein